MYVYGSTVFCCVQVDYALEVHNQVFPDNPDPERNTIILNTCTFYMCT